MRLDGADDHPLGAVLLDLLIVARRLDPRGQDCLALGRGQGAHSHSPDVHWHQPEPREPAVLMPTKGGLGARTRSAGGRRGRTRFIGCGPWRGHFVSMSRGSLFFLNQSTSGGSSLSGWRGGGGGGSGGGACCSCSLTRSPPSELPEDLYDE